MFNTIRKQFRSSDNMVHTSTTLARTADSFVLHARTLSKKSSGSAGSARSIPAPAQPQAETCSYHCPGSRCVATDSSNHDQPLQRQPTPLPCDLATFLAATGGNNCKPARLNSAHRQVSFGDSVDDDVGSSSGSSVEASQSMFHQSNSSRRSSLCSTPEQDIEASPFALHTDAHVAQDEQTLKPQAVTHDRSCSGSNCGEAGSTMPACQRSASSGVQSSTVSDLSSVVVEVIPSHDARTQRSGKAPSKIATQVGSKKAKQQLQRFGKRVKGAFKELGSYFAAGLPFTAGPLLSHPFSPYQGCPYTYRETGHMMCGHL